VDNVGADLPLLASIHSSSLGKNPSISCGRRTVAAVNSPASRRATHNATVW